MEVNLLKKASKDLAKLIEDATAERYELNPKVILEPGWKNFLGSIEHNLFKSLPVILKYIKANPQLLEEV